MRIIDRAVSEGNSGQTLVFVTIAASVPVHVPASVSVRVKGGTAIAGKACGGTVDYIQSTKTVLFSTGQLTATFALVVCGDTRFELDETADVTLISSDFVAIGDGSGVVSIVNDDPLPG